MLTSLRRSIRSLKRSPAYFTTATLSLALGLGLCAASFLFIDSFLHPHLPYADVDRLYLPVLRFGNQRTPPSLAELKRTLRGVPGIESIAATAGEFTSVAVNGDAGGRLVTHTSAGFFDILGIRPELGRMPTAEEARTQSAALVTRAMWYQAFANANTIGDAHVVIGGRIINIVGVLPRGADQSISGDV
jgi:hypothetical protein